MLEAATFLASFISLPNKQSFLRMFLVALLLSEDQRLLSHWHHGKGRIVVPPSHEGRFDVNDVHCPSIRPRGLAPHPLPTVTSTSFRHAVAIDNINDERMRR